MKSQYNVYLTVASVTIILCGIFNYFMGLIRRAINVISTVKDIAQFNLNYSEVGTWKKILGSVGDAVTIYNHSFNALTIIQIISGLMAILLVLALHSTKIRAKAEKFKFIPFFCGVISCLFGLVSFLLLIFSKNSSIFLCMVMFVTLLIVPIIFTVFANKFWKEERT